ncbi:MAG: hypothetical protein V4638_06485 [Bacteroidota bacterium]
MSTNNLQVLEGKWHVVLTNFPLWLKGNKINPTFNYKVAEKNNTIGLIDVVEYTQNNKTKSIKGFDKPTNEENTTFKWRGKGLLSIASSKWGILHHERAEKWAIIYFEKTVFTPKGYDVICREKQPSEAIMKHIKEKLIELKIEDLTRL